MRTPRNILQHELIGLRCRVMEASNQSQVGLEGKIVDETMQTLVIQSHEERKRVGKKGSVFRLRLDKQTVDVDGDTILVRPEDRIKIMMKRW